MTLLQNRKAGFNFETLETYEAGIELLGTEVKALRAHKGSLEGSYVTILGSELYLLGAHIPAHQPGNETEEFDPYRSRKLILHKKEITELANRMKEKGLTIVCKELYTKGRLLKATITLARGKKTFDKRETIKKRDLDRSQRRGLAD